jgi:hypothetical protein
MVSQSHEKLAMNMAVPAQSSKPNLTIKEGVLKSGGKYNLSA